MLPLIAWLNRPARFFPLFIGACIFWGLSHRQLIFSNFLFGMLSAYSVGSPRISSFIRARLPLVGTTALVVAFLLSPELNDSLLRTVLLFVFFVSVVNGNSVFGLLRLRGSAYLGVVSYSIYLLHGIIVYWAFEATTAMGAAHTPLAFWIMTAVAGLVTIMLSGLTFQRVERPFIHEPGRLHAAPSAQGRAA